MHREFHNKHNLHSVRTIWAGLFASFLIAVNAHSACVLPDIAMPIDEQLTHLPDCQRNPAYLAQIGHLLNLQRRYTDALDHLERALLYDPDNLGIQLNYSIALSGSGDLLSAQHLLDAIAAHADLSPAMRQALAQAKNRLHQSLAGTDADAEDSPFSLRLGANLRLGHESNLLGTPSLTQLELSFPGELVTLPLTEGNQPRSGSTTRSEARLALAWRTHNGNRWEFNTNLSQRRSAAVPESDTHQSEMALEYNPAPANGWAPYASAAHVKLATNNGAEYTSQGITAGLQTPLSATSDAACSARVGLEWQDRQLASNPILSGVYTGAAIHWACHTAGSHWQISLKTGFDRPQDASRPGGDQTVSAIRAMANTGKWLWDMELSHAQDSTGYSALLDNNALRTTTRANARMEYQHPLGRQWLGALGLEWSAQNSNLPLFTLRNWGPYASVRWVW